MKKRLILVALLVTILLLAGCGRTVKTGPNQLPEDGGIVFGIMCDTAHRVGMWTAERGTGDRGYGYAARMTDKEYSEYCGR